MTDPEATQGARAMNRQRWRGQHVVRCADVVAERIAELPDEQVVRLAHAAAEDAARRAAVRRAKAGA